MLAGGRQAGLHHRHVEFALDFFGNAIERLLRRKLPGFDGGFCFAQARVVEVVHRDLRRTKSVRTVQQVQCQLEAMVADETLGRGRAHLGGMFWILKQNSPM